MNDARSGTGGKGQPSTSDTGTAAPELIAEGLGAMARDLEQHDDPAVMLGEIVTAAVAMIPGADGGSISVVTARSRVTSQAPTTDLARQVDALQEEMQQGPCLDAAFEQQTVRVDDLATEQRWPRFARRASETGVASMLSLQLFVRGNDLGALNLYSRRPYAFTDESEQIGLLFATHAAVAWAAVSKEAQFDQALAHRDLIGQAKGILMERFNIPSERAFLVLVRLSQDNNRKLYDVAGQLVRDRVTPGGTPSRQQRRPGRTVGNGQAAK